MLFREDNLKEIGKHLDVISATVLEYESQYEHYIDSVHPNYKKSAKNLIHYLAYRTFDNDVIQNKLHKLGFPSSTSSESNILHNLITYKTIVKSLLNQSYSPPEELPINKTESNALLKLNAEALFGKSDTGRYSKIMVTQPTIAAEDKDFVNSLINVGMDCARINCAHDDEFIWKKIIDNIKNIGDECKIMMDLGGPKLRTGKMKPGPKVIHIKPKRNLLGQVTAPSKVWIAPYGVLPQSNVEYDAVIPVNKKWLKKTKKGSYIVFYDSRGKKCKIFINSKEGIGRWASCYDSAFVETGTLLNVFLEKKSTSEIHTVHELLPLEEVIYLFEGDLLRLDMNPVLGEPTQYDEEGKIQEIAHISCSLPQILPYTDIHDPVFFDDGKIEGYIKEKHADHLFIEITSTKKKGGKLRADKGINLPESELHIEGLTEKDKSDLKFIAKYADAVNFSFVNNKQDVKDLLNELNELQSNLGIILKIETKDAFKNLPSILLKAMENYPIGVMIARGDLAIETGWKNFAVIQEEIMRLCEAAHLPTVWATQVLENLAKKGIPTRSEITDAAMAQRSDCVMLNKGWYIERTVKMLDKILRKMQQIQSKKSNLMPQLRFNQLE